MKKLIIIDGNSLLFRAYYATAYTGTIMRTKDGVPTNAVFAFANMLTKIFQTLDGGEHILVAFDTDKKTMRHEQLDTYKANRKPAPEELIPQFALVRELLAALNIYTYEEAGFEADDIAGTMAKTAGAAGYTVEIYTSDQDYLQLIDEKITIKIIRKGIKDVVNMNSAKLMEEYGLTPDQIRDYKGLRGDASDNIPGIPGIGDKTATKLIQEYGSLEAVLEAAPTIKGKLGENLVNHADDGLFYKKLATIITDMELPFTVEDTLYLGYEIDKLRPFATRYELNTFLSTIDRRFSRNVETDVKLEVKHLLSTSQLDFTSGFGLYVDADGVNYHRATIKGIGFALKGKLYYLSVDALTNDKHLKKALADSTISKYTFDSKRDYVLLNRLNIEISGIKSDLMLAGSIIDSTLANDADSVISYFGLTLPEEQKSSLLSDENDNSLRSAAIALYAQQLNPVINNKLTEIDSKKLFDELELPLATVIAKMEIAGFPIDANQLNEYGKLFEEKRRQLTAEIYQLAGKEFNIASPSQVATVLFDDLHLPANKKRSTSVDILKYLSSYHPIVDLILEHRKYAKLISTYIEGLSKEIYPDSKFHAIFNQGLTTTGRLSSQDPNLQNIAVRDEEGRMIRKAFYYPNEDDLLLSFDYSQIELRILASLANCQPLIDIFATDRDIHTETAKKIFATDDITSLHRRKAKAVNFGIVYGISDWGLSEQLEITPAEAKTIIYNFHQAYPEVATFLTNVVDHARENGYVTTMLGRRRYLREISDANYNVREFAKRAAMNAPIQGTAADLVKLAMVKIDEMLTQKHYKTQLVLQIHDELLFRVPKAESDAVYNDIKYIMENCLKLNVKLHVEGSFGRTWYDTK